MKRRIRLYSIKTFTVILSLLMIFYVLPSTVYAEWFEGNGEQTSPVETETATKDVFELKDRREESVKHFRLEDGSIMAVQYADAVHRPDESGKWQDIDNTLSAKGSEFTTSDARVKFAKKITGNEVLFTLHEHNRKITMSLDGAKKKTAGAVTNTTAEFDKDATQLQKLMTLDKLSAKILYADILDGVDLEYVAVSNDIKENIIVKERKDNYTYTFTIKLNNLEAELTEVGSVVILDPDTKATVYVIPSPIVYDANNIHAAKGDAYYTLTESGNNTYSLSVIVNADWMNDAERAFPVVVDPTVAVVKSSITDTYIDQDNPQRIQDSYNFIAVGHGSISEEFISYLKFDTPSLPTTAYISSAALILNKINWYNYTSAETLYIGAYQALTSWTSEFTWSQFQSEIGGEIASEPLSYAAITAQQEEVTLDITSLFRKWADGSVPNYGISVRAMGESFRCFAMFASTEYVYNSPVVHITYRDTKGIEPYWSYSSQSAGLAGTGYINRATGALTFTKGLLSTTDSLFPYTPTLVYSSSLVMTEGNTTQLRSWSYPYAQTASQYSYLPLGFKWNMQETLIKKAYKKPDGSSSEFFIWSDADGTEHYFLPVGNSTTKYEDEDGLQLKLTVSSTTCTISDDSKTVKTFSPISTNPDADVLESWYLTGITDKNGNELSFTFDNDLQPTKVCLTPNGSTIITFLKILYTNGLPYLIWNDVSKEAIVFRYSATPTGSITTTGEQYLRELVYAHGNANTDATDWLNFYNDSSVTTNITVDGKATYTYNTSGYLTDAKDEVSDYRISYSYNTSGKVSSVKEYGKNSAHGQRIWISYHNGYTEVGSPDPDSDSTLITRYTFDREGRVVSVYTINEIDDDIEMRVYGASAGTYETDRKIKNNIKESVTVGGSATNYLLNGKFESTQTPNVADHWIRSSANVKCDGSAVFYVFANTTDSVSQYTRLPEGTYTLSMSVATHNCQNVTARVIVYSLNRGSNVLVEEIPINERYASGNSTFISTSFNAEYRRTDGTEDFRITIQVSGGNTVNSDVWFSVGRVMLENNIGNSNYNMVEYGNFEAFSIDSSCHNISDIKEYWKDGNCGIIGISTLGAPFGRVLRIEAEISEEQCVRQTFYQAYDLYAYNMTYTVSGFAKGTGQVASANGAFGFRVVVKYYDNGPDDEFCFDFQTDCRDWQFVCGTFTTSRSRYVRSIDICCEYSYQPDGYAMFDNISVYRNDDENVVKRHYYTDNPAILEDDYYHVEYKPTLAGLVHTVERGSYMETYEYNDQRQLVRKANNCGELYEYTYINNGADISNIVYYKFTINGTGTIYPCLAKDPDSLIIKTPQTRTDYTYTSQGLCSSIDTYEAVYNANNQVVAKPGAKHIYNQASYRTIAGSRIFGALDWEMNATNETTLYFYDESNGRLLACINESERTGTCYSYDAIGNLTNVLPATYSVLDGSYQAVANAESVSYSYNAQNRLDEIATESTVYSFSYDLFGNAETVSVGNDQLVEYEYNQNNGTLKQINYGNGYAEKYVYDKLDNLKEVWYTDNYQGNNTVWSQAFEYTYTAYGQLYRFDDLLIGKSTIYKYNTSGKLTNFVEFDDGDRINEFASTIYYDDETGNISSLYYSFDYHYNNSSLVENASFHYHHAYHSDGMLRYLSLSTETTGGRIDYTYDTFKRLTSQTTDFYVSGNSSQRFTNTVSYGYESNGNGTSGRISTYTSQVNGGATTTYQYTYDDRGNITQIKDGNDVIQYQYQYDDLGQLIREDNRPMNSTYVYTYDNAGNRTSKSTYAFTTGTLGTVQSTVTYAYGDSDWGDKLTSYTSGNTTQNIEYDEIGNPTFIGRGVVGSSSWNGNAMEWSGRNLISFREEKGRGGSLDCIYTETFYTYNADGIRTSKWNDGVSYTYCLEGSRIIVETVVDSEFEYELFYLYDANGSPIGMQYREPSMAQDVFYTYWFEKNLQGDIVAVYNDSGVKIITYTYDAWGNFTGNWINASGTNIYAMYNPFRYRGYYYDTETGFYYLNSRYYNPEWGRFINADAQLNSGLLGYNMFAYCNNNPVMNIDPDGNFFISMTVICIVGLALAGAAAGGYGGYAYAKNNDIADEDMWKYIAGGATLGAVAGATVGAIVAPAVSAATGIAGINVSISAGITVVGTGGSVAAEGVYYQVTSYEAAQSIANSNKLVPSASEGSVCVLNFQPTLQQARDLGARSLDTVIRFETHCKTFVSDPGNIAGALRNSIDGIIRVFNVTEVGFK